MKKSLIALAFGTLGLGIAEFVMMAILPYVAKDLHISIPTAGHLISAYALGVCAGAPMLTLARKLPLKKILLGLVAIMMRHTLIGFSERMIRELLYIISVSVKNVKVGRLRLTLTRWWYHLLCSMSMGMNMKISIVYSMCTTMLISKRTECVKLFIQVSQRVIISVMSLMKK